jgi:hypothetical protein
MRKFLVGLVGGLLAFAGIAGSASASATIDLLWATSGGTTTTVLASDTGIILNVYITTGAGGTQGAGLSVDYSDMAADFSVTGFTANPNVGNDPLPLAFGSPVDTGTAVENINAASFPPFVGTGIVGGGVTYLLGTVTFDSTGLGGTFVVDSGIIALTDGILNWAGGDITATTTFNGAGITTVVPEPGTLSLLGMGLGGLYVVGRRSSRKR